jgi:hypothetical protein
MPENNVRITVFGVTTPPTDKYVNQCCVLKISKDVDNQPEYI